MRRHPAVGDGVAAASSPSCEGNCLHLYRPKGVIFVTEGQRPKGAQPTVGSGIHGARQGATIHPKDDTHQRIIFKPKDLSMKHLFLVCLLLTACVFAQAPANRVVTKNIRYRAEEEYTTIHNCISWELNYTSDQGQKERRASEDEMAG